MPTEAKPLSLPTLSSDVPHEIYRVLIGWALEQWSIKVRSTCISATPDQHLQAVLACKAQVATRPEFTSANPIIETDESDLAKALKTRPEYAYLPKFGPN